MHYGQALVRRADRQGFGEHASRAAKVFTRAVNATEQERADNPQLKVVGLDMAEAHFMAGEYSAASRVARDFKPDSNPDGSTNSYVPVAQLLIAASDYFNNGRKESPLPELKRILGMEPLPYPEVGLAGSSSSGQKATQYTLTRWGFGSFDKYACTKLAAEDRDVVLDLSRHVQRQVAETGDEIPKGCN